MSRSGKTPTAAKAIILRSRSDRLAFLRPLHTSMFVIAGIAVLAATVLSYGIARTVTRPLGVITATMREMAATGDLTRKIPVAATPHWEDEDARLLASTFNTMTDSISRFQREAAQRERLSSLGRLSTVVAHEIRNPLMIIKAALRGLRRDDLAPADVKTAVADIDEEIVRLNRIVSEVLDFARPIRFDIAPADLNALCADALKACGEDGEPLGAAVRFDRALPAVATDAERLRLVLINLLTNARHAVAAREAAADEADSITLTTVRSGGARVAIEVRDRGTGISAENLPRIFDPYFTTRHTGTGLGLAISRNIVEGLRGTIARQQPRRRRHRPSASSSLVQSHDRCAARSCSSTTRPKSSTRWPRRCAPTATTSSRSPTRGKRSACWGSGSSTSWWSTT